MKCVEILEGSNVLQGDLVFIYHRERPVKSGWWRKVRYTNSSTLSDRKSNGDVVMVLEKYIHPDYIELINIDDCLNTRCEDGVFLMKDKTFSENVQGKYEVFAVASGVASVLITQSGYTIPSELTRCDRKDFVVSESGLQFFSELLDINLNQVNEVKEFAKFIKKAREDN